MGRGSRKRGLLQSQCLAMTIYLFLCFQRRTDFARSQRHTSEAVNTAQCAISHSAAISLQVCKWNALFLGFGAQEIRDKRETKRKKIRSAYISIQPSSVRTSLSCNLFQNDPPNDLELFCLTEGVSLLIHPGEVALRVPAPPPHANSFMPLM